MRATRALCARQTAATGAAVALFAASATLLTPRAAEACGGLFCSAQLPVNQAAERIIFVTHEDESVTAIIQIQYQGPSEQFSWVLPVPGVPDVDVSSNLAFTRLQNATNPQYTLTTEVRGECAPDASPLFGFGCAADSFNQVESPVAGGDGVDVVGGGSVGPYDYDVIAVDPDLDDPADAAVTWLGANGYDVGALGPDVLRPYLEEGLNLLAFRLNKDSDVGSIRPVRMRWVASGGGQAAGGNPSIPIRPTAVAANDDMGVLVWNVGPFRSVPANYRSLELNDARINWFNPGLNYLDVIDEAADEAGGHGFVTEMSLPSERMAAVVFTDEENAAWVDIRSRDLEGRGQTLVFLLGPFAGWDGLADVARDHVPLRGGWQPEDFASCPSCVQIDQIAWDTLTFLDAMEAQVIEPMRRTQELLLEREQVTRLYTTLSPDEMDEDPVFAYNPALPDLDNVHDATRVVECNLSVTQAEAPWSVALPSGLTVYGQGFGWPVDAESSMPANLRVLQDTGAGPPEVIVDNEVDITSSLDALAVNARAGGCGVLGGGLRAQSGLFELALVFAAVLLGRRVLRRR